MTKADVEETVRRYPFVTETAAERVDFMPPWFLCFSARREKGTAWS